MIQRFGALRAAPLLLALVLAAVTGAVVWPGEAGATQTMVTPEGVTINVYTDQVSAQQVYDVLKANGLETRVNLATVNIRDTGFTYASVGADCVNGQCMPAPAHIYINVGNWLDAGYGDHLATGHEYGHVWENYYRWTYWQGSFDAYLAARGLTGDPRLGSSHCWQPYEMAAEDYRALFGSPEARSIGRCNKDIPAADQVPGLRDWLARTFTNGNPPLNYMSGTGASPTPTPTGAPNPTISATSVPTVTPAATPTPTAAITPSSQGMSSPSPTVPSASPETCRVSVPSGKGWSTFSSPCGGRTDITVYKTKGTKQPTNSVAAGANYWAKGPVVVTITTQ